MKTLLFILFAFIAFYLLFVILLYLKQNKYVYFPPSLAQIDMGSLKGFVHQEVQAKDGLRIKGYYLAPRKGKPIIVEFHGNASHPAWEVGKFQELIKSGYGLLLAEYRGYGENPGTPSEENLYLDGDAYLNWVRNNPELNGASVIIYGSSIGSGVAVDAARNHPEISALILEVPFNTLSAVGAFHYPYIPFAEMLMKNKFPNTDKIKAIKAPVLFLLAKKDIVVPVQFGLALADAANEPKFIQVFDESSHTNIYQYGAEKVVFDFLKEHVRD